ncbi:ParA family protein [uncultured Cellulomonas sp.]|uniref:ParA family protein n=1 Tax=uncultured Cellulomonas sp. TaxID=189682 RepID=UPI002633D2EE|nr:ParA family protein [uncultured Cellulomonas sp.]
MLTTEQRRGLSRVIAVATGKGGVGKTSITANVAGLLAAAEMRVLAVDLDSQSNLGEDLGYTATGRGDHGEAAFQAITTGAALTPIRDVRANLDVIPAGEYTEDLAGVLDARRGRRGEEAVMESLAVSLAPIAGDYDVVLLDCPPKGRVIQEIALAAARWLLIPTKSDVSSRKAISHIADRFTAARTVNPEVDLLGVVLFGSGTSTTRLRQDTLREIAADLQAEDPLFHAVIRHAEVSAVQARNSGRLVHELEEVARTQEPWYTRLRTRTTDQPVVASSVTGLAGDYQQLAEEIVARLEKHETGETDR